MLLPHETPSERSGALDSVHNYYEKLVIDTLQGILGERFGNNDYTADIACIALNNLPPQYIRHDVDMAFYLSPDERQDMLSQVSKAVDTAINLVDNNDRRYDD